MTAQSDLSVGMWWQRPTLYLLALSHVLQRALFLMEAGSPFPRAAHSRRHRPPGSVRGFSPQHSDLAPTRQSSGTKEGPYQFNSHLFAIISILRWLLELRQSGLVSPHGGPSIRQRKALLPVPNAK